MYLNHAHTCTHTNTHTKTHTRTQDGSSHSLLCIRSVFRKILYLRVFYNDFYTERVIKHDRNTSPNRKEIPSYLSGFFRLTLYLREKVIKIVVGKPSFLETKPRAYHCLSVGVLLNVLLLRHGSSLVRFQGSTFSSCHTEEVRLYHYLHLVPELGSVRVRLRSYD